MAIIAWKTDTKNVILTLSFLEFSGFGVEMKLFIYLASPGFLAGMPVIVSQLLRSREGQTTTPGSPCPTLYE